MEPVVKSLITQEATGARDRMVKMSVCGKNNISLAAMSYDRRQPIKNMTAEKKASTVMIKKSWSLRADPGNGPCQRTVLAEYINNNLGAAYTNALVITISNIIKAAILLLQQLQTSIV